MKIEFNKIIPVILITFFFYQLFFKNKAEANPQEAYKNYEMGKAILIDVREVEELKEGMIKGSISFPLSQIEKDPVNSALKIKSLAQNKIIYLYCRSGNRSGKVKNHLESHGIKSVNLGGFSSLIDQKLPVGHGP
jgi:phage shock protein E